MGMGLIGMFVIHLRNPAPHYHVDLDFAIVLSEWDIPAGTARPNTLEMTDFNVLTISTAGMFTIIQVRDRLQSYDKDPGWYQHPRGTVALTASAGDLARGGIDIHAQTPSRPQHAGRFGVANWLAGTWLIGANARTYPSIGTEISGGPEADDRKGGMPV